MGFHRIETGLSPDHIILRLRGKKNNLQIVEWSHNNGSNSYTIWIRGQAGSMAGSSSSESYISLTLLSWFVDETIQNKLAATIFVIACIATSLNFAVSDAI